LPVDLTVIGLGSADKQPPSIHRRAAGAREILYSSEWILEASREGFDVASQNAVGGDLGSLSVEAESVGADGGDPDGAGSGGVDTEVFLDQAPLGGEEDNGEFRLPFGVEQECPFLIACDHLFIEAKGQSGYGSLSAYFLNNSKTLGFTGGCSGGS
jgi:hypothetical protein